MEYAQSDVKASFVGHVDIDAHDAEHQLGGKRGRSSFALLANHLHCRILGELTPNS
jgi:hypothetical protein